jgi:hypothetical protein
VESGIFAFQVNGAPDACLAEDARTLHERGARLR